MYLWLIAKQLCVLHSHQAATLLILLPEVTQKLLFQTYLPLSLLPNSSPTVPYVLLSHLSNESGTGFQSSCQTRRL